MRFSTFAAALVPVGVAVAQTTHQIIVGNNGTLTFSPEQLTGVAAGDSLQFVFAAKNHTVTQSSFNSPCTEFAPPGQPQVDSGFQFVAPNTTTGFPSFTVAVSDVSAPLWFYCRQTLPVDHCQMGMVFAVNPTDAKPFSQFQATAMGQNSTSTNTTAPASTDSTAPPAATGGSSAAAPPASAAAGSSGAPVASLPSVTSTDGSSSGSPSATTTGAPAASSTNAAPSMRVGTAGALLGGVGLLALAL